MFSLELCVGVSINLIFPDYIQAVLIFIQCMLCVKWLLGTKRVLLLIWYFMLSIKKRNKIRVLMGLLIYGFVLLFLLVCQCLHVRTVSRSSHICNCTSPYCIYQCRKPRICHLISCQLYESRFLVIGQCMHWHAFKEDQIPIFRKWHGICLYMTRISCILASDVSR